MQFLIDFQTGIFWVLKMRFLSIFMNFLAARAQPERAEFRFNDLKRKSAKKLYKM